MAGKITKRETSAWGDTIHRETKAGNHTETFNNFWGDQETTWTTKNSNGDTVKHTQIRRNGKLLEAQSEVINKAPREKYIENKQRESFADEMLESIGDGIFEFFIWLVISLGAFAIKAGLVLAKYGIILAVCLVLFSVYTLWIFYPLLYNYCFVNIFYHNLVRTTILAYRLRKNLQIISALVDGQSDTNESEKISNLREIFDETDKIAGKLEKHIVKKNAVGMEELMIYWFAKEVLILDSKNFVNNISENVIADLQKQEYSMEELKRKIKYIAFPKEEIYESYIQHNNWYVKRNRENCEFIKKKIYSKEVEQQKININSYYVLRLAYSLSLVAGIFIYLFTRKGKLLMLGVVLAIAFGVNYKKLHNTLFKRNKKYYGMYMFLDKLFYCKDYKARKFKLPTKVFKNEELFYLKIKDTYYVKSSYCATVVENTSLTSILWSPLPNMFFIKIKDFKDDKKREWNKKAF